MFYILDKVNVFLLRCLKMIDIEEKMPECKNERYLLLKVVADFNPSMLLKCSGCKHAHM